MRRTPLRFRPSLADALERRAVPSPLGGLSPVAEIRPATVRTRQIQLRGTVLGGSMTTTNPMIADIPTQVELSAIARVRPLGIVRLSGRLTDGGGGVIGTEAPPQAEGTLTLSSARGTLTLRLESVARLSRPAMVEAEAFRYTIQSGTGAYRRLAGEGAASLTLGPPVESPIVWVPGPEGFNIPKPVPVPGQFALVLHPDR